MSDAQSNNSLVCSFCKDTLVIESPIDRSPCWRCHSCNVRIMITNPSYLPSEIYKDYWRTVNKQQILATRKARITNQYNPLSDKA